jgi:S-adenosylmethionine synthetase
MEKYMSKTAESVSPKHPDKLCDQVSDAILDAILEQDRYSRVAVEVLGGHNKLVIIGEITSKADVDYKKVAKRITGIDNITTNIVQQSPYIAQVLTLVVQATKVLWLDMHARIRNQCFRSRLICLEGFVNIYMEYSHMMGKHK